MPEALSGPLGNDGPGGPVRKIGRTGDLGPPLPAGPASGQQPHLEKMPLGILSPILSRSASTHFLKEASTLTLLKNFSSRDCGQLGWLGPVG